MAWIGIKEGDDEKIAEIQKQWEEKKDTVAPQRREHPTRCECGMGFCDCKK